MVLDKTVDWAAVEYHAHTLVHQMSPHCAGSGMR